MNIVTEPCEHMLSVIEHAKAQGVEIGGCGDCGSPWLECILCNVKVEHVFNFFPPIVFSFRPSEGGQWDWDVLYGQRVITQYNGGRNAMEQVIEQLNRGVWNGGNEVGEAAKRIRRLAE